MSAAAARPKAPLFIRNHHDLPPPVILLGMHRSGTSILAQMLGACGLFLGQTLDGHHESPYFRRINDEFLGRAGSYWAEIDGYLRRRPELAFREECRAWAEARLRRTFGSRFIGLRNRTALAPVTEWGWKDPRTCLTMDVWNEIFPEARLLHVTRHPLDVAISIQRREAQRRELGKGRLPQNEDLDRGLRLWEQYVADAMRLRCEGARYHELRFEDLLQNPRSQLEAAARFCGLASTAGALETAAEMLDGTRTRRYDDEQYAPWREKIGAMPLARELGYE